MLTSNPFTEIAAFIPPSAMKIYVVLMILLVIGGTVLDMIHKQSAKYFFANSKKAQANCEFCNSKRRMSHLMTMYGFIFFVVTTAILIFKYTGSGESAPGLIPFLWHLGALSLCVGGYWFWFSIRVDVASEGVRWNQINGRGDFFILGLLSTATFALLWSFFQAVGAGAFATLLFVLFIISSTFLFGSVYWSKFAHMFFKPAAAFQKKVAMADGSRENLPEDFDLSDPETHKRFPDVPMYMGTNPPNMGLGIKAEPPRHY